MEPITRKDYEENPNQRYIVVPISSEVSKNQRIEIEHRFFPSGTILTVFEYSDGFPRCTDGHLYKLASWSRLEPYNSTESSFKLLNLI